MQLVESTDLQAVKDALVQLNAEYKGKWSFAKLFSHWELPTPIQHAINTLFEGYVRGLIYILIAKSIQFQNLKVYIITNSTYLKTKYKYQMCFQLYG
jgi:hypothetical protein